MRGSLANSWSWQMWRWGHTNLISCFWSYKSLKNDQATRLFFFFFRNQSGKKMVYKQQNALWRVRSGDKTTKCRQMCTKGAEAWMVKPLSAGCVNTVVACWILITSDYIWLGKSSGSEKILTCTGTRNRKITLCGLVQQASAAPKFQHCNWHLSHLLSL